jgi:dTDP-4-amino-4,6-dideoxygalactose transaminase
MKSNDIINVTKTFLPPIEEYENYLKKIWKNNWLSNRGELVVELEKKICLSQNVSTTILMANGTIPIQIALKVLGNNAEIITTPFSYVATSSAIIWENCKPVFVDIDDEHLTIDENKIEAAITNRTTCILATHVFGNPCNIEKIYKIAQKNKLHIIYDAAHCFGVKYNGKSIFSYGTISTCSFHATKLFHTGEGGALFCDNDEIRHKCFYSHNFGHDGPLNFHGLGINGKISELQAAMGLSVLKYLPEIIIDRKKTVEYYNSKLDFSKTRKIKIRENTEWNYSYYPLIFNSENELLDTISNLNKLNIFPRRYFYPSLNAINFIKGNSMPISENICNKILCLPLYYGLTENKLDLIINVINNTVK